MNHKLKLAKFATASALLGLAAPVAAQQADLVEISNPFDADAEIRINLSGKLRMLSQQIAATACHMVDSPTPEVFSPILTDASSEFDRILLGLRYSDPQLGMTYVEEQATALRSISDVDDVWQPIWASIQNIDPSTIEAADVQIILEQNIALLDAANNLVTNVAASYVGNFETTEADSFLIEMAGRQRMLLQQISKEVCIASGQFSTPGSIETLTSTMRAFETTLFALRDGMPAAGIRRPPNQAVADGLNVVYDDWVAIKPVLLRVVESETIDAAEISDLALQLNAVMADMNDVVEMYLQATTTSS